MSLPLLCILTGAAVAQETTEPATIQTERVTTESRLQRAPRAPRAPEGTVWPTAAGKLGGATSATQSMPTDVNGLIQWRRPFTNRPEFRAAWITRFDWTGRAGQNFDAIAAKAKIVELMDAAKKLRLNAVVWQVRGDATTLYPSKLEPWSELIRGKDPGFDPCKYAIEEAHKRGLEFHAYVNPMPCTEERTTTPASKDHIYYKHCMPDDVPNWLVHKNGKPLAPNDSYRWFNPNLPEVQTYIRTALLDLVKRYDIDGIHFDRIRFPSPDVSDDPWSKARYNGDGNPNKLAYPQWQAENITRFITDMYGQILEMKPKVKVSASVWGIYDHSVLPQGQDHATGYSWTSSGLQDFGQDSVGWINAGAMDALIPMIYWSMGDMKPDYDELLATFMTSIHNGRHVYGGQSVFSKEEMLREVVATNVIGAQGTCAFTLNGLRREGMAEFYQANIYPSEAKVPDMPWKSSPNMGHIIATVTDKAGKPVTDAHVNLTGRKYVYLTTTEGTCAMLDIVPGEAQVSASSKDGQSSANITVQAGKVSRVSLKLDAATAQAAQGS